MRNKFRYIAAGLALALGLTGCSGAGSEVSVERVDRLSAAAAAADRFAGVVVSENAVNVSREMDMIIDELMVQEGDTVRKGQKLFSYDSDDLNLTLDKQELEQDRLENQIDELEDQITAVEKEIKNETDTTTKNQLNIQLRQLQMELTQAEYDESNLKLEINNTKKMLKNVNVTAPAAGTIRDIDENSYDAYIVIQEAGAFRIKGLLNEMNVGMGIMEGTAVQIVSRLDPNITWTGVVDLVDYENAESNSYDAMYYGYSNSMTTSSSYPFYVSLDTTEGLLLGQHVYIQAAPAETDLTGLVSIPEDYLMDLLYSDETGLVTATVWAVNEELKLEKRPLTLGEYDMATGSYYVLEGLSFKDYVANPDDPGCREGASVTHPDLDAQEGTEATDETVFTGEDDETLSPEEQESMAASIAADIENGG